MPIGTVKMWKQDRGFGFIKPDDGEDDVFLHISAAQAGGIDLPEVGDRLKYEIEVSPKSGRPQAGKVAPA